MCTGKNLVLPGTLKKRYAETQPIIIIIIIITIIITGLVLFYYEEGAVRDTIREFIQSLHLKNSATCCYATKDVHVYF